MLSFETKKAYYDLKSRNYISWDYYQNYINVEPPFGQLGVPVSIRTYHRYVPELNRREKWSEVCLRVVEYSLSLDTVTAHSEKVTEAEELFDCLFNLRGFAAGRTYWVAGTEQTNRDESCNYNCVFTAVDSISTFSEIYYWLLIGAGVGFSVEKKNVNQLPKLYSGKTLTHYEYEFRGFKNNSDHTHIYSNTVNIPLVKSDLIKPDQEYRQLVECLTNSVSVIVVVGDSKEGWCNALRALLTLYTFPEVKHIYINYDNVRPEGSPIKVFGGRASGHRGVLNTLRDVSWLIEQAQGNLTPLVCQDIINTIGRDVASGGVRRTAQLSLFDSTEDEVVQSKVGLFTDPSKEKYRDIRVMSNNSVALYENPGLEKIKEYLECLRDQGDPGFWIVGNSQKFDERVSGTNPCGK
jgi:adenosylcobalamin-dependent ribonucleoside-triphosphate reductase